MRIVVGLGNPGKKYVSTRHNVGFLVIDELAKRHRIRLNTKKAFKALIGEGTLNDEKIMLVKPMTYMNNSGISVKNIINYTNGSLNNLLVAYDDLHLPLGEIRIRSKGSSGGHKGINSLMMHLDTTVFSRLKIGLGPSVGLETATKFVLGKFSVEEGKIIQSVVTRATEAIECWVDMGINKCMNQFN
ncbi:aminoacyl-tRNA hydrolase [Planctomycetota bacterium]